MTHINAYGIKYKLPKVYLAHATPLFVSEFSARTCYNSFDKSEHESIKSIDAILGCEGDISQRLHDEFKHAVTEINSAGSELLHQLSHVYFHESTLEHVQLNFFIKDTSRGVLQELARHRIGVAFSVQSTRYTMSDLINRFLLVDKFGVGGTESANDFFIKISALDLFVTTSKEYNALEINSIYTKLIHQLHVLGRDKFYELSIAKSSIEDFKNATTEDEALEILERKAKRNVGDPFKHIISDNFSVDLGFTMNLRALKNLFDLRLSGAAYWQIQLLAAEIYAQIPENYLTLVVNDGKRNTFEGIKTKIEAGLWE